MKAISRNRYLKGFFALGLALSLSNIYISSAAEVDEEQRLGEESILRFDSSEMDFRKIANASAAKLNQHITQAVYHVNSGDGDLQNHLKVAKEIVKALHILMPHMQMVDHLKTLGNELKQGEYNQFNGDSVALVRKADQLQPDMPQFSTQLKQGLQEIEKLIQSGEQKTAIVDQFNQFYANISKQVAYIPIKMLENRLKRVEKTMKQNHKDTERLLTQLDEIQQSLLPSATYIKNTEIQSA